jgi:hypothetical protein
MTRRSKTRIGGCTQGSPAVLLALDRRALQVPQNHSCLLSPGRASPARYLHGQDGASLAMCRAEVSSTSSRVRGPGHWLLPRTPTALAYATATLPQGDQGFAASRPGCCRLPRSALSCCASQTPWRAALPLPHLAFPWGLAREATRPAWAPAEPAALSECRRGLYHCDYCHKDLSHVPRIKCAVCPDFDLCLECFSVGAQTWPHANDHAYRVVDNLSFPLYHPEWGVSPTVVVLFSIANLPQFFPSWVWMLCSAGGLASAVTATPFALVSDCVRGRHECIGSSRGSSRVCLPPCLPPQPSLI